MWRSFSSEVLVSRKAMCAWRSQSWDERWSSGMRKWKGTTIKKTDGCEHLT